ncbi:MAG TPA: iron-sulfur cluster assembly protein [Thermoplasmata archaeon]|nr:iron-sulfur cluster assembly protein [Thermoplasmata archaeon]
MSDTDASPPPATPTSAAAPAAPAAAPSAAKPTGGAPTPTPGPHMETEVLIIKELKKIYDPEIPMNIVDLGLIYSFEWGAGDDVVLHMTLTAPGCPVAGILADEIQGAIEKVPNVTKAKVDYIWDPPWTPERMSDFAKRQFGYL